ncbi:hypothetical protein CYY_008066 [Polysphondylium violaceum]|uniref:Uncharacterized protein n=1 Tax=Polysphondylium violaceum TaxID=133409 RepID=A0A8J4PQY6_9MYCE|nr:hypothetical protein CYY_008066 [Polysphondylium violaceum]
MANNSSSRSSRGNKKGKSKKESTEKSLVSRIFNVQRLQNFVVGTANIVTFSFRKGFGILWAVATIGLLTFIPILKSLEFERYYLDEAKNAENNGEIKKGLPEELKIE